MAKQEEQTKEKMIGIRRKFFIYNANIIYHMKPHYKHDILISNIIYGNIPPCAVSYAKLPIKRPEAAVEQLKRAKWRNSYGRRV